MDQQCDWLWFPKFFFHFYRHKSSEKSLKCDKRRYRDEFPRWILILYKVTDHSTSTAWSHSDKKENIEEKWLEKGVKAIDEEQKEAMIYGWKKKKKWVTQTDRKPIFKERRLCKPFCLSLCYSLNFLKSSAKHKAHNKRTLTSNGCC